MEHRVDSAFAPRGTLTMLLSPTRRLQATARFAPRAIPEASGAPRQ